MKFNTLLSLSIALILSARALALTIPSDGSDGAFNPMSNVVIDLGLATNTSAIIWSDSNVANAGNGIYDHNKWAVVFKYSSVNIPAGVTVEWH